MSFSTIFLIILAVLLVLYVAGYVIFSRKLARADQGLLSIFLLKTAKIPSLIEVMRPYVADATAFDTIIDLHAHSMIQRYETIYDLLEHNARIEREFLFLMKLSMQIPSLQKNEYFVYIRDFVIRYERNIRASFTSVNDAIHRWNQFVRIKNLTGIGLLLPGRTRMPI